MTTLAAVAQAEARRVGVKMSTRRSATFTDNTIVDCNGSLLSSRFSRLLAPIRLKNRATRKHGVPPPGSWMGAAKLERNVGDTVISVSVSEDDSLFAAGAVNRKAVIYSTASGEVVATFMARGPINAVVLAGMGARTQVIVGTFNSQIAMWPIPTVPDGGGASASQPPDVDISFGKTGDAVLCMAVGAQGTRLAVGGAKSRIALYAIEASSGAEGAPSAITQLYRVIPSGPPMPVLSLCLDRNATLLAAGGESKIVHIWDLPEKAPPVAANEGDASAVDADGVPVGGAVVATFRCASAIHSVSMTANGEHIACGISEYTEVYELMHTWVYADSAAPDAVGGGREPLHRMCHPRTV